MKVESLPIKASDFVNWLGKKGIVHQNQASCRQVFSFANT